MVGTSVPHGQGSAVVIGVLPENFRLMFPLDASVPSQVDYYESIPIGPWQPDGPGFLHLVGRLRSGRRLPAAQAELVSIARQINALGSRTSIANYNLYADSLQNEDVREVRQTLVILFAGVAFVLLIGCANVANLLLARARLRLQEITVRAALGATRQRLARQFITETLLLVGIGGCVALFVAWAALKAVAAPPSFANLQPAVQHLGVQHLGVLDLRVLAFTFAVALLTSLFFGLAPISAMRHLNLAEDLKRSGRSSTRRRGAAAAVLVACEIALAFVLLLGTGLLVRTFANILHVNPGFQAANVFTFRVSVPDYKTLREVEQALTSLPGVQSVSTISHLPLDDAGNWYDYYWKQGAPAEQQNTVMADHRSVLPGYFATIGAQLIEGRDLMDSDDAAHQHVAVIDDVLAHQLWPGEDALGKRINVSDSPKGPFEFERDWVVVVGVVRHVQCHTLTVIVRPQIYLPYQLAPRPSMSMVLRSGAAAGTLATLVRRQIARLNRNVPITHLEPLSAVVERARADSRFVSILATLLAVVALQLALCGIYGVLSYSLVQRSAEIGIRMALGAQRSQILRLVFAEGFVPVALGIAAGIVLSIISMPLLDHFLFEIKPGSAENYGLITVIILVLSAISMMMPAIRAMRINPVTALASE